MFFCDLSPCPAASWVIHHYSSIRVPTLILRVFFVATRIINIYLGLGSYRLTIKERNGGVGIRGKNRVVDESTPCVANVNCEDFYDGETELL